VNASATSQSGLNQPDGLAFDSSGNLWVADSINNRVLEFAKGNGFASDQKASLVLGQSNFGNSGSSDGAAGMYQPEGLAFDSTGDLWVAELLNARAVEFVPPFVTDESASTVLGQPSFGTLIPETTQTGMSLASGVAIDKSGDVWVSDQGSSRVLEYGRVNQNCTA
jgi:secreted PhoX family phosphatase